MVRIKFFAHFRELFGAKDKELALAPGATVKDILDVLCDTAERRKLVFDGQLRPNIVVMKNGSSILSLKGLATALDAGDTLAIFPMLGGG